MPFDGRNEFAHVADGLHLFGARPRDRHVTRRAFLEEQLGGLDTGRGVEARAHPATVQRIRDRDEHHALVVRHVGANHCDLAALGKPRRGVVECLVEAVGAAGPRSGETPEVFSGRRGIDHRGQARRIGRDDDVLIESPAQSEPRHAEVGILVGHLQIPCVVGRLRHAPRDATLGAISDLPAHDESGRLLEQASGRRAHDEPRHEVLEHRPGPRDEHRVLCHRRERATQPKPV